jgi:hypothetical protein
LEIKKQYKDGTKAVQRQREGKENERIFNGRGYVGYVRSCRLCGKY